MAIETFNNGELLFDVRKKINDNATKLEADLAAKADKSDLYTHVAELDNPHQVTKTQVGLSYVDNTADSDKPISSAVQTALGDLVEDTRTSSTTKTSSARLTTLTENLAQQNRQGDSSNLKAELGGGSSASKGTSLGVSAVAGISSVSLGCLAYNGDFSVAVGANAEAKDGTGGVAVGTGSTAGGNAVSVGYSSEALSDAVALGYSSYARMGGVAIGKVSEAIDTCVAIGQSSIARIKSTAIGATAYASDRSVSLGGIASNKSTSIGYGSNTPYRGTAVGYGAFAQGGSVSVGSEDEYLAVSSYANTASVSVGNGAISTDYSCAVGVRSYSEYTSAAFGYGAVAGMYAACVGHRSSADRNGAAVGIFSYTGNEGTAVGAGAKAYSDGVAVGYSSTATEAAVSFGKSAKSSDGGITVGWNSRAAGMGSVVVGYNVQVNAGVNMVRLGCNPPFASTGYNVKPYIMTMNAYDGSTDAYGDFIEFSSWCGPTADGEPVRLSIINNAATLTKGSKTLPLGTLS